MSWNWRVVRKTVGGKAIYAVHEAYYDESGRVWAATEESVAAQGGSVKELEGELRQQLEALDKPVLDYDSIPEPGAVGPPGEDQAISWGVATGVVKWENMVSPNE